MRADTRTTRKTAYRNSIYVQGNTARRLEVLPQIEQPHRRVSEQTHRNRARARRMNIGYVLFLAVAMVAAGMILTMYLSLQSDITNSIKNISRQEKILNDLRNGLSVIQTARKHGIGKSTVYRFLSQSDVR